jgi:hypothetical protein
MTSRSVLIPVSIAVAVLWTAGMYWSMQPRGMASLLILMVAGTAFGFAWSYSMGVFLRWWFGRQNG